MVNGKSNGSITEGWEQQVEGEGMIILIYLTNNENLSRTRLHILAIFFILQYT